MLLVEDSLDNQRLVSMYLNQLGVEVVIAGNGSQAIERIRESQFDLVLMDMQMPIMDGLEATGVLRSLGISTPIVALTANAMKEDVARCHEAGCDAFLAKPIDHDEFVRVMRAYLESAAAEPESCADTQNSGSDGNALFSELVATFLSGLPVQLEAMQAAYKQQDWPKLKALAHKLKGAGGGFGHMDLTEMAAALELSVKQDNPVNAAECLIRLSGRINELPETLESAVEAG